MPENERGSFILYELFNIGGPPGPLNMAFLGFG